MSRCGYWSFTFDLWRYAFRDIIIRNRLIIQMDDQLEHVLEIQEDPGRLPAFRVLEIALGVTLSSPDNSVSHLAAQALRLIAHTERHVRSTETAILEENWPKRHLFYEQLGDPRTVIVGMIAYYVPRMRTNHCPRPCGVPETYSESFASHMF